MWSLKRDKYGKKFIFFHAILLFFVISCFIFIILVFLSGCAPIFSDLQSARLVGKGKYEVTPGFSTVSFTNKSETDHIQNHFGLQAAYGVHDNVDLRLRYERVTVDTEGDDSFGANVLGFGPKIRLAKDNAALYMPIGFAFGEDVEDISTTWEIHPTLLFTIPVGNNFDLNPSAKVLIPLNRENADVLVAFNLGAGISADLTKWVIRPEYGLLFNLGEDGHYSQFSIGLTVYP